MLKPGQVIILQGHNIVTQIQGDTSAKHVCQVSKDPSKVWTTGANLLAFYGLVDASAYLSGKTFILAETVEPLTDNQLTIIEQTHQKMRSQFYGFWKYGLLEAAAWRKGKIPSLLKKPDPTLIIKNPICSQAVGCALWRAGVRVGEKFGKLDATALLPETFENEVDRGELLIKAE